MGQDGEKFMFTCLLETLESNNKEKWSTNKAQFFTTYICDLIQKNRVIHFIDYFSQVVEAICTSSVTPLVYIKELFSLIKPPLNF